MPKIIPNLKQHLLEVSRTHLLEEGLQGLKIRSIASDCEIGLGTVYNYFSGKHDLYEAVMRDSWNRMIESCRLRTKDSSTLSEAVVMIYQDLTAFISTNQRLIEDDRKRNGTREDIVRHRSQLIESIRSLLTRVLERYDKTENYEILGLLAELLLTSALQDSVSEQGIREMAERIYA